MLCLENERLAHASPTDTKRSHPSARLGWVTFWVTSRPSRGSKSNAKTGQANPSAAGQHETFEQTETWPGRGRSA